MSSEIGHILLDIADLEQAIATIREQISDLYYQVQTIINALKQHRMWG